MDIEKQIYWLFRCTEKKYASWFYSNGTIKLNTPSSWINHARKDGMWRGDLFEGVYSSYHLEDSSSFSFLKELKKNIESETDSDIIF